MKLHYSQTALAADGSNLTFYYLMKLHYSQTIIGIIIAMTIVLLPYEITLFSNYLINIKIYNRFYYLMKLHYSQTVHRLKHFERSFTTL